MKRRTFLAGTALQAASVPVAILNTVAYPVVALAAPRFAPVVPQTLAFPRDHGSHPAFRTEWWYLTGWAEDASGRTRGVQVTFFRSRPGVAEDLQSALAPTQILFAHAALADPAAKRLAHDQRAARAVLGLAHAAETTTDIGLDDWSLVLDGTVYRTHVGARDFVLDLAFAAPQAPLLEGDGGLSRKGPDPAQASYYYSRPQLAMTGTISVGGRAAPVTGKAWLDHEWSSEYLGPAARGWDWTGLNFPDGGALMAFRIRGGADAAWAGGTWQRGDGSVVTLGPDDVRFDPLRRWRSPRTGIEYPVAMRLTAGALSLVLEPLFDDQELDARASVGTVYWEGAVQAHIEGGGRARGYLELTGYGEPLRL